MAACLHIVRTEFGLVKRGYLVLFRFLADWIHSLNPAFPWPKAHRFLPLISFHPFATKVACRADGRILAITPLLNDRKSASIPSLKITPSRDMVDSTTSS